MIDLTNPHLHIEQPNVYGAIEGLDLLRKMIELGVFTKEELIKIDQFCGDMYLTNQRGD